MKVKLSRLSLPNPLDKLLSTYLLVLQTHNSSPMTAFWTQKFLHKT